MFQLKESLQTFGGPDFESTVKREIEQLDASLLPLQQGLSAGGYAQHDDIKAMLISAQEEENSLRVKAGIFYYGVISGCSCADDPSPTDVTTEYCELMFIINRLTKHTTVSLADK